MGLSVLARGSLHEKLQWAFNLYDINGRSSFAIQFALRLDLKPFPYKKTNNESSIFKCRQHLNSK